MKFFDFLKKTDINRELEAYDADPDALLLDVRTAQEYAQGHIPGSRNIPLQHLDSAGEIAQNKNTPIYVYCQSGSRSRLAAGLLQQMGYRTVKNLGGISAYSGRMEF